VVGEPDLVALACGVYHEVGIQVEQEAAHVLVVDLASTVGLVLSEQTCARMASSSTNTVDAEASRLLDC
jgi:hypothetical protein